MVRGAVGLNCAFCLIFIVLSLICYFNTINSPFILDDDVLVVKNLYIKKLVLIPQLFKVNIFYFANQELSIGDLYYRPLQALSYAFDYSFGKLNTYGYHLVNIFLHAFNSFILFLLLGLIFKNKILVFLTSAIFCIHPIQGSVVAYITGRGSILEAFFILCSLFLATKYFLNGKLIQYLCSLLMFIFALLSREGAILLPFLVSLFSLFLPIDKKRIPRLILPYLLIAGLYILFRAFFMPCSKCTFSNFVSFTKIRDFIFLSQNYLSQLILPIGLRGLFFRDTLSIKVIFLILAWLITGVSLAGAVIFKRKTFIFGLILYFLSLLPTINLIDHISYYGVILCEHYLYLASIGIFFILASLIIFLERKIGFFAKLLTVVLFLFYFSLTIINNNYYKDEITFYRHILSVNKDNRFVRINLGNAYFQEKMFNQAINQAHMFLVGEPDAWEAYLLLGNAYFAKGQIDLAIEFFQKTIKFNPVGIQGYLNLGIAFAQLDKVVQAEKVFNEALIKFPSSVKLRKNLGALYGNMGDFKKAIFIWQGALLLDPQDQSLKDNISYANKLLTRGLLQ